ncbi:periplasmic solute binding family protein, partial [Vibrio parahaemolyticus V-223/04]
CRWWMLALIHITTYRNRMI